MLGRTDMFPLLQTLLPCISGILGERWLQSTNILLIFSQVIFSRPFGNSILVDVVMFY